MSRIIITHASSYGQTRKVAEAIAAELRRAGHIVDVADSTACRPPPVEDYDVAILGSRVQFGVHAHQILDYISENREALDAMPSYFFSVSMSAAGTPAADPNGYLERLFTQVKWRPRAAIAIGGGLPYRQYGPILRFVMKQISRRGGHTTDTRHDHDCTDWVQVRGFATRIAAELRPPRPTAPEPRAQA